MNIAVNFLRCLKHCRKTAILSTSRISYELPDPNLYRKFYCKDRFFQPNSKSSDHIDWSNWNDVIEGFRSRIVDWYFIPLSCFPKSGDEGYPIMCTMCAIIDLLTQYEFNLPWHNGKKYKHYLRTKIPEFKKKLYSPVIVSRFQGNTWVKGNLKDYADVFYTGIRCSLHHHGDLAPYAGISEQNELIHEIPNAGRSVCGTHYYSLMIVNPWKLRDRLLKISNSYCDTLKKDPRSNLAKLFRSHFYLDFGISIPET